jgi:flagellin
VNSTIDQNQLASLQTSDAAINVMGNIVTRISELSTMAGDTTKSTADVANYNSEFTTLTGQLTSLLTASTLTSASVTALAAVTSLTAAGAGTAITAAVTGVGTLAAANGASQAQYGFQSQYDSANATNLEAANSAISDVDVAQESTQLARWNVLVQAGTAMLAQANSSSQVALKLLQ